MASSKGEVAIYFNDKAGPQNRKELVDQLESECIRTGYSTYRINNTQDYRDGSKLIVCGGDGTLQRIVHEIRSVPLAIFPIGSENLMAGYLGIDRDLSRFMQMFEEADHLEIDIGKCNDLYFCIMATCGFDSDIVERVHRNRKGHISKLDYISKGIDSFLQYSFPQLVITDLDSEESLEGCHVFIFNAPIYARGWPLCPQASVHDGKLDILVFEQAGKFALANYFQLVFRGIHQNEKHVKHMRSRRLRIAASDSKQNDQQIHVQADGDPITVLPCEIELVPHAVQLILPKSRKSELAQ